jgi:hypothetical protein
MFTATRWCRGNGDGTTITSPSYSSYRRPSSGHSCSSAKVTRGSAAFMNRIFDRRARRMPRRVDAFVRLNSRAARRSRAEIAAAWPGACGRICAALSTSDGPSNGTRLGPYEIVGALGVGRMGEVYRATRYETASRGRQPEHRRASDACSRGVCNELFLTVSGSDPERGRMMGATVRADGGRVTIGAPAVLFDVDAAALEGGFDVTPDGKTFCMRRRAVSQQKERRTALHADSELAGRIRRSGCREMRPMFGTPGSVRGPRGGWDGLGLSPRHEARSRRRRQGVAGAAAGSQGQPEDRPFQPVPPYVMASARTPRRSS